MSTDESTSNGSAISRAGAVLALFEKEPEVFGFCLQHQAQMIEAKRRVKQYIADVTVEDIQQALENYLARKNATSGRVAKSDDEQFRLLQQGLQAGLLEVVKQIDRGYRITMGMYTAAFVVGIAMLITSTVSALLQNVHSAALLGGLGAADIVAFLVFKPAQELQSSRGSLAQLQAAFFSWINDVHNWNDYLDLLQNEAGSAPPSFEKFKEISEIQARSTGQMVHLIAEFTRFGEPPKMRLPRRRAASRTASPGREPPSSGAVTTDG
jgi:hypothetical protein